MHPKDRPAGFNRRDFLRRSGGAALGLSSAGSLLAACSNSTTVATSTGASGEQLGPGGYPLARPGGPRVTLRRWEDPIASGLQPETGGTFNIYNYPNYLDQGVMKEFGKKYNVNVQLTAFQDINSGIARLANGGVAPDVMEMTPDNVARVVTAKLIKPLNLDYIPNLKKNVWPSLVSPFYDVESRYTVPYTTYATGILWRNDKVTQDIAAMKQPLDIFWEAQAYTGKTALLSEPRETIAMALLRRGITDINTEDPKLINRAVADLDQLNSICNIKVGDTQFQTIPEGTTYLNQAWSGDWLAAYIFYLPKGTPSTVMSYWKAPKGHVPVQNDCWSICSTTKKPVLAHLWLNFINDNGIAKQNFLDFNGYQPPLEELDPATLISDGTFPEGAKPAILTKDDFGPASIQEMTLTNAGQALWQNGYSKFSAGG
jgi:spermidine/putrescine transport system substrate-binding protein